MPTSNPGSLMLTYQTNPAGQIMTATIPDGTPPVTTLIFAPGALVTSLETSIVYRNAGTSASPVWEDISTVNSSEMDQGLLKTVAVALSAAQIIAMYTTPVLLLAGVAGKAILLDSLSFDLTGTATQFTGGGVVNAQYDSTANGAGTTLHADIAATVVTGATSLVKTHRIGKDLSAVATASIDGKGIYISNKTAAFAVGTGTALVTMRYHVI